MKKSNYEITKEKMQAEFVKYDQEKMIRQFGLAQDPHFLYIQFVDRTYRIDRTCGKVEGQTEEGILYEANFNEAMSIYDVLCNAKENCHPSGRFTTIQSLPGVVYGSTPGKDMFQGTLDRYDHRLPELKAACEALGGRPVLRGDVSYEIPLFPFLSVVFQFWESDEEFPTSLQFLWDEQILDYMHYETTFYVASHILDRLREIGHT